MDGASVSVAEVEYLAITVSPVIASARSVDQDSSAGHTRLQWLVVVGWLSHFQDMDPFRRVLCRRSARGRGSNVTAYARIFTNSLV